MFPTANPGPGACAKIVNCDVFVVLIITLTFCGAKSVPAPETKAYLVGLAITLTILVGD